MKFDKFDKDYQVIYNSDGWGSFILERKQQSVYNMLDAPGNELKKLSLNEAVELSKSLKIPISHLAVKENEFYKEMTELCVLLNTWFFFQELFNHSAC